MVTSASLLLYAISLAQRLLALAPAGLEHVFFSDSGSVSIEVAMRMGTGSMYGIEGISFVMLKDSWFVSLGQRLILQDANKLRNR